MHGTAALAILLVVQVEPSCVRLQEGCQRRGVRENVAVFEKADITSPKLYYPCAGRWHSVFAGTKEEKERNGKEIRDGLRLRGQVSTIVSGDALDGPDGERQL